VFSKPDIPIEFQIGSVHGAGDESYQDTVTIDICGR